MRQFSIARKAALLITLSLATQVSFGIALLVFGRRAVEAHGRELHSQQVLDRAHDARAALLEAQSGLRGLVASGVPAFRARCDAATREATGDLVVLRRLVADNPAQLGRVDAMSLAANRFLDFQQLNARLVEAGRRSEAAANIGSLTGDRMMGSFLAAMDGFLDSEGRLGDARHESVAAANRAAIVVVIVSLALSVGVAVLMTYSFSVGIKQRLNVLTENARRLADARPLLARLNDGDEIAMVDRSFHAMAQSLARAMDDLQHANREMEAFSYSVSHDLRAPLRAIDGFSRILEEEYTERLDAEGMRLLQVIRRNTVTMAQLIDDLLAFSRLSRQTIAPAEVDMKALAAEAFAEASRGAANRGIDFVLHDLPPAKGDTAMLRQVFANLLSNAVKFTAPRTNSRIEVGAEAGAAEPAYYVRDNGVGFDPRFVGKLFGVFQRLHASREFEGTGVGLAIVQRVIHRHGGRVWAESVVDGGATFHFTLGRKEEE
jgi:signal transduction histidine kinase